ncbi:MAG TPA: Flp family type IVb pilin [Coriobacteriia bacterium]|jgi:Flp pilus assembly pilin Flp
MLTKLYVRCTTALHSEEGSTGVEYAILVAVIAVAVALGATAVAPKIPTTFNAIVGYLK